MGYVAMLIAIALLLALVLVLGAYVLAYFNICFTFMKEGTARAVMRGETRDHMLLTWHGHRLNDPRRSTFDSAQPEWEVIPISNNNELPSVYEKSQLLWRLLEWIGVYYYGLWPFKQIYTYKFQWAEEKPNETGKPTPLFRDEYTNFIFVKDFPYWIRLSAAEDKDNESLNLDYLLTIHVSNPEKALFKIDAWLSRTTADANNKAKIYVGARKYDDIRKETIVAGGSGAAATSQFATEMCELTNNLLTEPAGGGAKKSYGITINGASLVAVDVAGSTSAEIETALVAKRVAQLTAEATVATAKGDAKAMRERAKGEAEAIDTVYGKVTEFGEVGMNLQLVGAIKESSKAPGNTMVWANNPLGGISDVFRGMKFPSPRPKPSSKSRSKKP